MNVLINDEPQDVTAQTLDDLLSELGFTGARIATAVNGDFVPKGERAGVRIQDGLRIEIVAPMQGG